MNNIDNSQVHAGLKHTCLSHHICTGTNWASSVPLATQRYMQESQRTWKHIKIFSSKIRRKFQVVLKSCIFEVKTNKNYILEKCKFYISPSIYVNLECKFFQKCKSVENVNLQFFQTQGWKELPTNLAMRHKKMSLRTCFSVLVRHNPTWSVQLLTLSQGARRNFNGFLPCLKRIHFLSLVLVLLRFPPRVDLTFQLSPMSTEKKNFKHFAQQNPYFGTTPSSTANKRLQEWTRRWLPSRTSTSMRRSWSPNALPINFRMPFRQNGWSEQKATALSAVCAFVDTTKKSIPTTLMPALLHLSRWNFCWLWRLHMVGTYLLETSARCFFTHFSRTKFLWFHRLNTIPTVEFFGNFGKQCMDWSSPLACGSSTSQVSLHPLGLNAWNLIRTCTSILNDVATCCATLTTCWFSVTRKQLNSCSPNFRNSCAWDRKVYLNQVLRLVFLDVASPVARTPLSCLCQLPTLTKCLSNLTWWNVGMRPLLEPMHFVSWLTRRNFSLQRITSCIVGS